MNQFTSKLGLLIGSFLVMLTMNWIMSGCSGVIPNFICALSAILVIPMFILSIPAMVAKALVGPMFGLTSDGPFALSSGEFWGVFVPIVLLFLVSFAYQHRAVLLEMITQVGSVVTTPSDSHFDTPTEPDEYIENSMARFDSAFDNKPSGLSTGFMERETERKSNHTALERELREFSERSARLKEFKKRRRNDQS